MNDNDLLQEGERLDDLQRNGLTLIQNPSTFCFGMDAILLSHFATIKKGDRVLDLGCGNGIMPILLTAISQGEHFTGLEIQQPIADMARRSVLLNKLENRVDIVNGDIKEAALLFRAASFNVVITNPPYMNENHGITNPTLPKAIARHELLCSLEDVIGQAAKLLVPGGRFFMVHRPFRLTEIFDLMKKYRIEPKRMQLVYPFVDKEPNMVLIEGVRGGKTRISVEKPLIIYQKDGNYQPEIYDIYGY